MSHPMHVPISFPTKIHQNQTLSYEFRVVEHVNDEGKVTAYIMQTQIWAHNPPDHNGNRGNPMLVQDWTDVPRVRVDISGATIPSTPTPSPISRAPARGQMLTSIGSAGSWDVNPYATYGTVSEYMKDMAEMLEEDEYEDPNGVKP